jgi:Dynein heavy chain, N-terminal region 1.
VECYKKNGFMLIDKNLPPTAGALIWINKLRDRILGPFETLKKLEIE